MIFEKVLLKVGCWKPRLLGCIRIRVPRASWGEVVHCSEQHSWLQHQRRGRDQHGWEQQGVLWEHYVQGRSHAGVTYKQPYLLWSDVWRLHFGICSFNFQRKHPGLQGDLRYNICHARVFSRNCPRILERRKTSTWIPLLWSFSWSQFQRFISWSHKYVLILCLSSTAAMWTSCWRASAMAWWRWPPRRCSPWTQSCWRSGPWRRPILPTNSWTCRGQ